MVTFFTGDSELLLVALAALLAGVLVVLLKSNQRTLAVAVGVILSLPTSYLVTYYSKPSWYRMMRVEQPEDVDKGYELTGRLTKDEVATWLRRDGVSHWVRFCLAMRLNTLAGSEEIAAMQLPDVEDAAFFGGGPRTTLRRRLRFPAKVEQFR